VARCTISFKQDSEVVAAYQAAEATRNISA
jgi:hypothetical protein